MSDKLKNAALIAATFLIIWMAWLIFSTPKPPIAKWTPAEVSPKVKAVPKVSIKPPKVQVYTPAAKGKLVLPPEVKDNPVLHVLTATLVLSDLHDQTVTTIIDDLTGESHTLVRREPLPWLRLKRSGEARLDYGVTNGMGTVVRLTVRQDLLQIKRFYAGVNLSADTDGSVFAGVGLGYRW